jgi:hypothetical protein
LNAGTISEIMLFKNFLARKGEELSRWHDAAAVGVADEIAEETDMPKKRRRHWWNDSKT